MNLMDILAASLPNEQQIYAQNPFISSGQALAQTQLGVPTTNTEAILGPALQGLISGTLQGYGRRQANQQVYDAYKANPLLQAALEKSNIGPVASGIKYADLLAAEDNRKTLADAFSGETPAKDWTPAAAKTQVLMQALGLQSQQDAEAKRAELMAQYDPTIIALKAEEAGQIEAAKSKNKGKDSSLKDLMGAENIGKLAGSAAVIDEARSIADILEKNNTTWTDVRLARAFGGLDKEGIALQLKNLADNLGRARTGAAMTDSEIELYEALAGGGLTSTPAQTAKLLRKLADAEARMSKSKVNAVTKIAAGEIEDIFGTGSVKYSVAQLKDAGYSPADINALMAQGVVE